MVTGLGAVAIAGQRGPAAPAAAPQAAAPFDPSGYWVALVSDEWRYRMLTPPKGNFDYVPLNTEGQRVTREWDPARDESAGEQCKGYGAGGIMRLPARLHITWADERTLRMDIDTGTQTRTLHFAAAGQAPAAPVDATWQGYSVAQWDIPGGGRGLAPGQPRFGQMKVVTNHLRPGYLRKNGVPYGANAVLTEHMSRLVDDDGAQYLAVTSILDDPQYLAQPWVRTSQFRKQADARGWTPTACSAK